MQYLIMENFKKNLSLIIYGLAFILGEPFLDSFGDLPLKSLKWNF